MKLDLTVYSIYYIGDALESGKLGAGGGGGGNATQFFQIYVLQIF